MQFGFTIKTWNAWGPNIQSASDVASWVTGERDWGVDGAPDVSFLPALFRRRLSTHSRMVMASLQPCLADCRADGVRSVFASRWGDASITTRLLRQLAIREKISPMDFSLSVHNTPSGLFSIHYKNKQPSTALAGGRDTFSYALVEAGSWLALRPEGAVLVVISDEPLPSMYTHFADETQVPYAVALVLTGGKEESSVRMTCTGRSNLSDPKFLDPQALQFLRWWVSGEKELMINNGLREWHWQRG